LEDKLKAVEAKYAGMSKTNKEQGAAIAELKRRIRQLEEENLHLQNEGRVPPEKKRGH